MKEFLILIISFLFSVMASSQTNHNTNKKISIPALRVHEWSAGKWIEHDTSLIDSSEFIHKMLLGTWVDSNLRFMGVVPGNTFIEQRVYKDSIVSIHKYRHSDMIPVDLSVDSNYTSELKSIKEDTLLRIDIHCYKYKICYVDERKNNANFIGYAIEVPNDSLTEINNPDLNNFVETAIYSITKKEIVVSGMWGPFIAVATEIYKRVY